MTGKERSVLDTMHDDMQEMKKDIRAVMDFIATYTERSKHCAEKFSELEGASKWTRGKVILILGFGGGIGFAVGVAVKLFK